MTTCVYPGCQNPTATSAEIKGRTVWVCAEHRGWLAAQELARKAVEQQRQKVRRQRELDQGALFSAGAVASIEHSGGKERARDAAGFVVTAGRLGAAAATEPRLSVLEAKAAAADRRRKVAEEQEARRRGPSA